MNIKIILIVFLVVVLVNIPIFLIALSGIGYHKRLITCCIIYAYYTNGFFAYWLVKKIIHKFNL